MIAGVTGSRHRRPDETMERARRKLVEWGVTELHHGDCEGFDEQMHELAVELGIRTVAHPPDNPSKRAWCKADMILPEKPYLSRNRDIVDAVERLIAAPDRPEERRSGTWSTVRYAKSREVHGIILPWA